MRSKKKFSVTTVPVDVHTMISRLENAAMAVAVAKTTEDVNDAYTILAYSRKFLYEFLEDELEFDEDTPVTHLRFT